MLVNQQPQGNQVKFSARRFTLLAILLCVTISSIGCTIAQPEPGDVAVYQDRPYLFGHEGIRAEVLTEGRDVTWPSTTIIYVTTAPQTLHVAFQDLSSMDNILLDFDTSVQLRIVDAADTLKRFGPRWWENNVVSPYNSIVRKAVKSEKMAQMMSDPAAAEKVDQEVTEQLRALIKASGIRVEVMAVNLGKAKPNENVLTQMNNTAAEQQRNLTLVAATIAEQQRKLEQEAKADADNAYRNKMGLSPEQYLARQLAEIQADACKKAAACYLVPQGTSVVVK
jgi:regulator of protease activity HflC (stomatin/prohibitin superfamily)